MIQIKARFATADQKAGVAIEIERRFLVRDPAAALADPGLLRRDRITQGYLGQIGGLRSRARILVDALGGAQAVLTLKGPRVGLSRVEYGYSMSLDRAELLIDRLPPGRVVHKVRYTIYRRDGLIWSVDRFTGVNLGLVLAEVELSDTGQTPELPDWVGEEVSFDRRYGNSQLARMPIDPRRCSGTSPLPESAAWQEPSEAGLGFAALI